MREKSASVKKVARSSPAVVSPKQNASHSKGSQGEIVTKNISSEMGFFGHRNAAFSHRIPLFLPQVSERFGEEFFDPSLKGRFSHDFRT